MPTVLCLASSEALLYNLYVHNDVIGVGLARMGAQQQVLGRQV